MTVLAIDTSGRGHSVALVRGEMAHEEVVVAGDSSHSVTLLGSVERVLAAASTPAREVTTIAVTSGPGSFTGLRIGMATAKGLALATGAGLAGRSTLRVLAERLAAEGCEADVPVCAVLDAGRGQVYRGLFAPAADREGPFALAREGLEELLKPERTLEGLPGRCLVGGSGALRYLRLEFSERAPRGARLIEVVPALAMTLARIVAIEEAGRPRGDRHLVPNYLRESDARPSGAA